MKAAIRSFLGRFGYDVVRKSARSRDWIPVEFSTDDLRILEHVLGRQLTMVGRERLIATIFACKHVVSQGIEGDFVECGVWRGGNAIVAADVFARAADPRLVFMFDTFAGMTKPTEVDVRASDGSAAMHDYLESRRETHNDWCFASLSEVKQNFAEARLLGPNLRFVEGDVQVSLSREPELPKAISVLRLDTDWYESTKLELEVLYPRLRPGGVLIVDDYGHWGGAKKAVDEYFRDRPRPLLQYTDHTGRMGVKLV